MLNAFVWGMFACGEGRCHTLQFGNLITFSNCAYFRFVMILKENIAFKNEHNKDSFRPLDKYNAERQSMKFHP